MQNLISELDVNSSWLCTQNLTEKFWLITFRSHRYLEHFRIFACKHNFVCLFVKQVRGVVSDFAVLIAILSMVILDFLVGIPTPKLHVPDDFAVSWNTFQHRNFVWPVTKTVQFHMDKLTSFTSCKTKGRGLLICPMQHFEHLFYTHTHTHTHTHTKKIIWLHRLTPVLACLQTSILLQIRLICSSSFCLYGNQTFKEQVGKVYLQGCNGKKKNKK